MNLNDCFPTIRMVNLNDLYLTRAEHERILRKQNSAIYILSFCIGFIGAMLRKDRIRLRKLEKELKKEETAG